MSPNQRPKFYTFLLLSSKGRKRITVLLLFGIFVVLHSGTKVDELKDKKEDGKDEDGPMTGINTVGRGTRVEWKVT